MGFDIPEKFVEDLVHCKINPLKLTSSSNQRPHDVHEDGSHGREHTYPIIGRYGKVEAVSMKHPQPSDSFVSPYLSRKFTNITIKKLRHQNRIIVTSKLKVPG